MSGDRATDFEACFSELLQRVLETDLGWNVLKNRVQYSGVQHGKDVHLEWETDGRRYSWSFECKSHATRPVRKEEVMPKILDTWRSAHRIDVWCLTLSDVEPGQAVDEFLPWARETLNLPFRLTVLSPGEHALQQLFACYPDLYKRVYSHSPRLNLSEDTRKTLIATFAQFLIDESHAAVEPSDSSWTLVTPDAPDRLGVLPDDELSAREYLRGFAPSDWDSIAHGWAVERPEAEEQLLAPLREPAPGVSFHWMVGPTGEGKSTLARLAAWRLASEDRSRCVLWAEGEFSALNPPLEWIDGLAEDSAVYLFVDGTRQLRGVSSLYHRHRRYRSQGRRVACVFIDRGVIYRSSPVHHELRRSRLQVTPMSTPKLADAEIENLIELLSQRGLLAGASPAEAAVRLREAPVRDDTDPEARPWLLPTLMELTDPDKRGFEDILSGFLDQLEEVGQPAALVLLLAAALAHAAGSTLSEDDARAVAANYAGGFGDATAVLASEMVRQLGGEEGARVPRHRLLIYSKVVADGLVQAALRNPGQRDTFVDTCHLLVKTVWRREPSGRIPKRRFDFLNLVVHYFNDNLRNYEMSALWLEDWIRADDPPIDYMGLQRLGECLKSWLHAELKENGDTPLARDLAEQSRSAFEEGLGVAGRLLNEDERPEPFWHRELEVEELVFFHSWAVLEGVVGMYLEGDPAHRRSAFFSVLGLNQGDLIGLGTLAFSLIHLKRFQNAAVVAGAHGELGGNRGIVANQRRLLLEHGTQITAGSIGKLGSVLSELAEDVLLEGVGDEFWPYSRKLRASYLARSLRRGRKILRDPRSLDAAISRLRAVAESDPDTAATGRA